MNRDCKLPQQSTNKRNVCIYFIKFKLSGLRIKVLLKNYIVHKENTKLRKTVCVHIEHLLARKHLLMILCLLRLENLKYMIKTKFKYTILKSISFEQKNCIKFITFST